MSQSNGNSPNLAQRITAPEVWALACTSLFSFGVAAYPKLCQAINIRISELETIIVGTLLRGAGSIILGSYALWKYKYRISPMAAGFAVFWPCIVVGLKGLYVVAITPADLLMKAIILLVALLFIFYGGLHLDVALKISRIRKQQSRKI